MDIRSALSSAISAGAVLGATFVGLSLPESVAVALPPVAAQLETSDIVRWDLPVVRNASVDRLVDLLHREQPDRMSLYLKRSGRYEGMIRTKLRERGMPEDFLYLAMIESGFDPNALSKAEAVGLWQFIAGTGRLYGLRIDSYVDERRDPERSTDAALEYLTDLYERFGSWNLAAAAYNSGGNRVGRIMKEETGRERGVETDFWRIRARLPSETREYIPLVFAAALIGKEPHKYGLEQVERLLPITTERVGVPGGTSLWAVAAAIGVPAEDIRELNPHLVRGSTPPGSFYPVYIPEGSSAKFAANFPPRSARTIAAVPPTFRSPS